MCIRDRFKISFSLIEINNNKPSKRTPPATPINASIKISRRQTENKKPRKRKPAAWMMVTPPATPVTAWPLAHPVHPRKPLAATHPEWQRSLRRRNEPFPRHPEVRPYHLVGDKFLSTKKSFHVIGASKTSKASRRSREPSLHPSTGRCPMAVRGASAKKRARSPSGSPQDSRQESLVWSAVDQQVYLGLLSKYTQAFRSPVVEPARQPEHFPSAEQFCLTSKPLGRALSCQ
eukprot:TRINITY_DN1816_c0_g1_i1.p2 TRINITY_DN1816_c0_g1~~TRINITY_DN1816_c0_g1_i1.p2  ORF type:complete len:232 (-),score=29.61 TRINITY_DN1816_c0_g1_i1:365-1060(-)